MDSHLQKIAASLGYSNTTTDIRNYVSFLEHRIIRYHPVDQRTVCNEQLTQADWCVAFRQYVLDNGCPLPASTTVQIQVHWLSHHAVSLAFEDCTSTELEPPPPPPPPPAPEAPTAAATLPAKMLAKKEALFDNELRSLASTLHILPEVRDLDTQKNRLVAIHAIELAIQRGNAVGDPVLIESLSSGLATTDPKVERAACVVRMLHLQEMHAMQVSINALIETAQSFVANPKTDATLGRNGR